ncbi:MAG: type III pantothenate kinase [Mycoplasmataceae bacterium]|jgi:type III pantothenate kinase|nr:type III pantothenate kinase [Mycoplasmataceae bacterium]
MQLIIDVGNTYVKFGLFNNKQLQHVFRLRPKQCTLTVLKSLFQAHTNITKIYFGSVVPSFNKPFTKTLLTLFHIKPQIILAKDFVPSFHQLAKLNLSEIGTDILAFALSISRLHSKALGICFGTATFAVAINTHKIYGVVIAPSIATGINNLTTQTAMIKINGDQITSLTNNLGHDTHSAIAGGSYHMFMGFINNLKTYCVRKYNIHHVYLTGGRIKQLHIKQNAHLKIIHHAVLLGYAMITGNY